MGKFRDLTNETFGEWKVLKYLGNTKWECECSCKNIKAISTYSLTSGKSLSCGHPKREGQSVEVGKSVWNWEILEDLGHGLFRCKCVCGRESNINISSLRYGYSKSCGCKQGEYRLRTMLDKYGESTSNKIDTGRALELVEILNDKDKLTDYINDLTQRLNRKPTISDLHNRLLVNKTSMNKTIHKFSLEYMIDYYEYVSHGENELADFIKGINVNEYGIKQNIKSIITPYELDIYIPDLKLAIEFNGDYWHSDQLKSATYHQKKTLACAKQGIQLIHIFEYEWTNVIKRKKIENLLKRKINQTENKVLYARNLIVAEIDNTRAFKFCDKYHLNLGINSKVSLGIIDKELGLVGVMTFGKPRFDISDDSWELYRIAYKNDVVIVGGSNKLFKYFITRYAPTRVISYCNIAKFNGKVYLDLGFKTSIDDITRPNFVWKHKDTDEVLSRYQTQKHELLALGLGKSDETSTEIMRRLGYMKIYDSGSLKFTWQNGI